MSELLLITDDVHCVYWLDWLLLYGLVPNWKLILDRELIHLLVLKYVTIVGWAEEVVVVLIRCGLGAFEATMLFGLAMMMFEEVCGLMVNILLPAVRMPFPLLPITTCEGPGA